MGLDSYWVRRKPETWIVVGIVLLCLGILWAVSGSGFGYVLIVGAAVIIGLALLARMDNHRNSSPVDD